MFYVNVCFLRFSKVEWVWYLGYCDKGFKGDELGRGEVGWEFLLDNYGWGFVVCCFFNEVSEGFDDNDIIGIYCNDFIFFNFVFC